ncbi:PIN domain-like protein [Hypoxylon sp. FL1857]|nr:PIN domain-like protein [Hypoxylon sp. FL1857]
MSLKAFSLRDRGISQTRSIAQWSSEFYERHNRPLRIAVDAANWWFRNVTTQKEIEIMRQSPGSHPKEKRILERLHYLLRMNIQLIFVFDGSNKPWKRRPKGQDYNRENIRVLTELLDQLGVPRHEAPGEAEAECARLQALGVVDAVWSDDSDTFMFGCTTLVQFHKPEESEFKSEDLVLVYTADSVIERSKLSREGLIMYAILVGCDYSDGLPNIGVGTLLGLAKHPKFQEAATTLVKSVSNTRELSKWRAMSISIFKATFPHKNFTSPLNTFPDPKISKYCCSPNVSSDIKLRGLVSDWFRPFGPKLFDRHLFLIRHFNSRKPRDWTAEYLVPIELNHRLREGVGNIDYGITEKTAIGPRGVESTIAVDPLLVIPEFRDLFLFMDIPGGPKKVNVTLLDCVIRQGLPNLVEKATKAASRGRPKKTVPRDNVVDYPSSREPQGGKSQQELATPAKAPRPRGRPRKRDLMCLEENNNHNRPGPSNESRRLAGLAGLPNAPARDMVALKKNPVLVIDNEDAENRDPNGGQTRYKRRRVDVPLTDIAVVDLTGED